MTKFFSEANKVKLAEMLRETGCPDSVVEYMTEFTEDEADGYMYAHAKICIKAAEGEANKGYLGLSAMCMIVMAEEAAERGWSEKNFPLACPLMAEFRARENENKTHH